MDDYNVRYENLPTDVRGVTIQNGYGEKCILLNARLNSEMNKRAFDHELRHIENDDFSGGLIREIEMSNHYKNK